MTPPRRDPLDDARRSLDEAAGALDGMRRLTGDAVPDVPAPSPSESVRREALASARGDLHRLAAELETARARGAALLEEVGRLREELAARPTAQQLEAARSAGDTDAARRAAELSQQVAGLKERVSLLSAEHVRLEALRRKAEALGADSEASRRSMEETLRRDLRAAHAALDRAAAESGTRDAKAVVEVESMRKRLDHALGRLQREDQTRKQGKAEERDFEAAQAVNAALRRELTEQRESGQARERELARRVHELELRPTARVEAVEEGLRAELRAAQTELDRSIARYESFGTLEKTLRGELSAAHAALERADARAQASGAARETLLGELRAAQAGFERAKAHSDASGAVEAALRNEVRVARAALERAVLDRESSLERRVVELESESGAVEEELRTELKAEREALGRAEARAEVSEAAQRSLREELVDARATLEQAGALKLELEGERESLGRAAARAAASEAVVETLRAELAAANASLERTREQDAASGTLEAALASELKGARAALKLAEDRVQASEAAQGTLRAELRAAHETLERSLERRVRDLEEVRAPHPELEAPQPEVDYPSLELALEPGWSKLLGLVKPPVLAAYGHLRRLSAGPLSAGQRAILRLTGSSLSQAADSMATIELALSDSPATIEGAPVRPALDAALLSWEPVLRRRGIALSRDLSYNAPDASFDPEQLRLALHHVLRNAVEALPRGGTLRVTLGAAKTEAVRLEFLDDGPGYPAAWLERRFEPFAAPRPGHAGLGLAAVRRALRRWGGDAEASNGPAGRGACLTLTFAHAPARPASNP